MSASNDLEAKVLDHIFGLAAYTPLEDVYVALYTSDPGEAGDAEDNETSGTGYARAAVENSSTTWTRTGSTIENAAEIDFGTAGGDWGTVTHFAIVSSASGAGDILFSGALTVAKVIAEGDTALFPMSSLTVTMD